MKVRWGWLADPLLHLLLFAGLVMGAGAWKQSGRDGGDGPVVITVATREDPPAPPGATRPPRRPGAGVAKS
jgi:hypothetical protein